MSTTPARRIPRRAALAVAGIIAFVAILYVSVIALYASSGNLAVTGEDAVADDDTVLLQITPDRVDAATNRLVLTLTPLTTGPLVSDDGFTLDERLSILLSGTDGSRTIDYDEHSVLSPTEVQFITEGYVERWPFDVYTVTAIVVASHEVDGAAEPLHTAYTGIGRVPGWNIRAEAVDTGVTLDDGYPVQAIEFTAWRSGSTIAFGIVLLSLMAVMPVLVLTVAITVYRGRRKVEATVMSWIGAMLFATIPLRNFLPGAPPIGSWVDYLVVLWVIAGLVAGLVIFVLGWLRRGPDGDAP